VTHPQSHGHVVQHPDDVDSNLTNFFAAVNSAQSSAATVIGTTMGMLADIGGAVGTINLIISLFDPQTDVSSELQDDFTAMAATLQQISTQIANLELETRRNTIDQVVAPALAAQESFPDLIAAVTLCNGSTRSTTA
jgi:quinolinate synthase